MIISTQARQAAGARRWVMKALIFTLLMAIVLFGGAGRLDWGAGWVLLGLYAIQQLSTGIGLWRTHPDLLGERADARSKAGVKGWDLPLTLLAALLLPLFTLGVAGLDARLGWSAPLAGWLPLAGGLLAALGMALTTWAMLANAYFSGLVRIQAERGHQVATGGPYRVVRHPGYVGAILYDLGVPLLLGSGWALIPSGLAAVLMIVRTALEDRTLHAELDGYAAYAQATRWRLLPGVW